MVVTVNTDAETVQVNAVTDLRPDMSVSRVPGIIVSKDSKVRKTWQSFKFCSLLDVINLYLTDYQEARSFMFNPADIRVYWRYIGLL